MSDSSIKVESRVLSGEEHLMRVLEKSVRDSLGTHFGVFSGIAALSLVIKHLVPTSEIPGTIASIQEAWAKEVRRSVYPSYVVQRDCINAAHPNLGDPFSGDEVFDRAVKEMQEIIQKSLLEEPMILSSLKTPVEGKAS